MTGKTPFAQIRYGVASPTLNYIDMFQMNDGTEFDWNNRITKSIRFLIKTEKHAVTSACMRHWPSTKTDSKGKKVVEIYEGTKQNPYNSGTVQ